MARVEAQIFLKKRWFFWPAVVVLALLGRLGLIRDKLSAAHWDGKVAGEERAAKWLVHRAMRFEVR